MPTPATSWRLGVTVGFAIVVLLSAAVEVRAGRAQGGRPARQTGDDDAPGDFDDIPPDDGGMGGGDPGDGGEPPADDDPFNPVEDDDGNGEYGPGAPSPPTPLCPAGQFECASGNQCVDHGYTCDGISDCQDQSDEGPVLCPTTTAAPVASTVAPCMYYEHRCADAECVPNWTHEVPCNGEEKRPNLNLTLALHGARYYDGRAMGTL